jgi:hypothetical protein
MRKAKNGAIITPERCIGHLGLDGAGDTKGRPESEMRDRPIKWITQYTNHKIAGVEVA